MVGSGRGRRLHPAHSGAARRRAQKQLHEAGARGVQGQAGGKRTAEDILEGSFAADGGGGG